METIHEETGTISGPANDTEVTFRLVKREGGCLGFQIELNQRRDSSSSTMVEIFGVDNPDQIQALGYQLRQLGSAMQRTLEEVQ